MRRIERFIPHAEPPPGSSAAAGPVFDGTAHKTRASTYSSLTGARAATLSHAASRKRNARHYVNLVRNYTTGSYSSFDGD